MIERKDLEQFYQKGVRVYLTFLDGEDQRKRVGGNIIQLIDDAIIFRIKTSCEYDRTIVIYLHRLLNVEDIQGIRYIC